MQFEDLQVWKRSARLCAEVYTAFADSRDFGFKDQITRSALSIASNIAEGYERDTPRDRVRFISYAKGSCAELRTQIYIGMEIGYINKSQGRQWAEETRELSKMLYGMMKYLRGESHGAEVQGDQGPRTKGQGNPENPSSPA